MESGLEQLLAPLRAHPERAGIVCDIDGTLAPIVADPAAAALAPGALPALDRLAGRYALVGCVTGRAAADARRLVPSEAVALAGNHGLEIWRDGRAELAAEAEPYLPAVRGAIRELAADPRLPELGCALEDKGITLSVHYRNAPDRERARAYLEEQLRPRLEAQGLAAAFGRLVLEARPPVAVDKGSALRRLRRGRDVADLLYAGDDRSDLDAFREAGVRIAVRSDEGPPELVAAADWTLAGPPQVVALLEAL